MPSPTAKCSKQSIAVRKALFIKKMNFFKAKLNCSETSNGILFLQLYAY